MNGKHEGLPFSHLPHWLEMPGGRILGGGPSGLLPVSLPREAHLAQSFGSWFSEPVHFWGHSFLTFPPLRLLVVGSLFKWFLILLYCILVYFIAFHTL